jgi:hypothetical protein
MGTQSQRFDSLLNRLWDSELETDHLKAAELYLRTLDYFKPKLARTQLHEVGTLVPPLVVYNGIAKVPDNWPGVAIRINAPQEDPGTAAATHPGQ